MNNASFDRSDPRDTTRAGVSLAPQSTKLTSHFHRFRPRSRKKEISDISLRQKCAIQLEMSESRISCTWNGARRSS